MKRIGSYALKGLGYAIGVPLLILLVIGMSPLIIALYIIAGINELYTKFWAWRRHDPSVDITIPKLVDDEWQCASTKEEFVKAFEQTRDVIVELSHAKGGDVTYEGFDIFDSTPESQEWHDLRITQKLSTKHAEIQLVFDFGAYFSEHTKALEVCTQDGDDQSVGELPPISAKVISPMMHIERSFTLANPESVWALVSLLRGDARFVAATSQLWALVREHGVWLAQYKPNEWEFGQRATFTNQTAHKFGKDSQ